DEKEENILGSIPLLSFRVAAVQPSDNISRKHTFKVTVCWVQELPAGNGQSLSPPQAEHAGIRTYFFSAENTEEQESWIQAMGEAARALVTPLCCPGSPRHEKPDSENIPPSKHHHHHCNAAHREHPKAEPDAKTRGEGDGRGSEKMERKPSERPDAKKDPLAKANGLVGQEPPSELGSPYPEGPRGPASAERPAQPNGWPYPSPSRPGSTAFPPAAGDGDGGAQRRGVAPRSHPEKVAQRKSSMTQLQQWVNSRRATAPAEELRSPTRFYPVSRRVPDYYSPYSPQYPEEYQYYPPGVRPDSICSMPAFDRVSPPWALEDKRHSFRNGGPFHPAFGRQDVPLWLPAPSRPPSYLDEVDAASGSLRRMSLQPRSRSVPRSPSQGSYGRARVYSPVRSPSARFERLPPRGDEIYADPATFVMRRSISSPKYDYLGDRRPVPAGVYPYHFPASPTIHDKMVTPFPEPYRDTLHPYKISEQDTDVRASPAPLPVSPVLVFRPGFSMPSPPIQLWPPGCHRGGQPEVPTAPQPQWLPGSRSGIPAGQNPGCGSSAPLSSWGWVWGWAVPGLGLAPVPRDPSELCLCPVQNEMLNRQIQREIWRIQDVMEGLRKNNPSRGTDTAKHRVALGPSGTYSSNSPASPLSSASLTSPLSPFSLISGSQGSPTKPGPGE
ncbi:PKHA6 protein, partial [Emberiza fucata]|nr:PKHA6 protein [Emberiza fucata]